MVKIYVITKNYFGINFLFITTECLNCMSVLYTYIPGAMENFLQCQEMVSRRV